MTFKPYGVGTQKNRLSKTILLSNQIRGICWKIREILWGKELNTPLYLNLWKIELFFILYYRDYYTLS